MNQSTEQAADVQEDTLELTEEGGKWRARTMHYFKGSWERVLGELPEFKLVPFSAGTDEPENPFLKMVLRLPNSPLERPVPVGTVSHSYGLAPHREVALKCLEGIKAAGVPGGKLRFEAGLSELGEWMNLRIYFPKELECIFRDGHPLGLRLECFNSVDGSSRLVILLGWLRFVCSNGMDIGETMVEVRSVHNDSLDLARIPTAIKDGLALVSKDIARMRGWQDHAIQVPQLQPWIDQEVATNWNIKAASRVLHICETGHDGDWKDPFAKGKASEKPMYSLEPVDGAPPRARHLYDVSQALSWVATRRNNAEERLAWQRQIPDLIAKLGA